MNPNLIIDVGMHTGRDTEFYLRKGFQVVAVEANPLLVNDAKKHFHDYLSKGQLSIYDLAIADHEGEVDFYINDQHDDWGTISETFAERNVRFGTTNKKITVECIQFEKILNEVGIPYYLKIDIEGADLLCLEALNKYSEKPKFVSIEAGLNSFEETFTELSLFWQLGYRNFKIVNQANNHKVKCPYPPLEGNYTDYHFDGLSSGPFGEETPGKWLGVEETLMKYRCLLEEQTYFGGEGRFYNTEFHRAYEAFTEEPVGWYDFHARLGNGANGYG